MTLLRDLADMIAIPSVNPFSAPDPTAPAEAAMAAYVTRQMQDLGLKVHSEHVKDGRCNVWGRLKGIGTGPTVMLAAHLDTVGVAGYTAPFTARIEDGKIYGRGACDMKPAFAAYFDVIRRIKQLGQPLAGDVIIAGVVDEEHGMIGSAHFGNHGPKVDYAIVGEPSELAVCPSHKGQVCMSIRTKGLSVHSSVPDQGINAIFHMSMVLDGLRQLASDLSLRPADPMCGRPSLSVGVISGGSNVSSVPDWCEIAVDRRLVPGETYETVLAEYRAILDPLTAQVPSFHYEFLTPELVVPPFATPEASPVVTAITKACAMVTGRAPSIAAFTGSTDAPNFKCDAVICGAGALAQCHSLNEYVDIAQVEQAAEIYFQTILNLQTADRN